MQNYLLCCYTRLQVVNNYNIRTEPHFSNWTAPNSFRTESKFFFKNWTEIKTILHIPTKPIFDFLSEINTPWVLQFLWWWSRVIKWQVDCMWCHSKQCSSKCDMCYWVSNCVCLRTKVLWCLAVRQRRQHKSAYQITYVHSDWMLPFGLSLAWLTLQQHVGEFSGCILFVWLWFLLHGWIFTACDIGAECLSEASLIPRPIEKGAISVAFVCPSIYLSVCPLRT